MIRWACYALCAAILLTIATDSRSQDNSFGDAINATEITHQFNQGIFWNPAVLPGWGFAIDVQKDILFGAIYGYDSNGDAVFITLIGTKTNSRPVRFAGDVFITNDDGNSTQDIGSFNLAAFIVSGQIGAEIDISSTILSRQDLVLQRFQYAEADPLDVFAGGDWFIVRNPASSTFSDTYNISQSRFESNNGTPNTTVFSEEDGRQGALAYFTDDFVYGMLVEFNDTTDVFYMIAGTNATMFGRYWLLDDGESPVGAGSHFRAVADNTQSGPSGKGAVNSLLTDQKREAEMLAVSQAAELPALFPAQQVLEIHAQLLQTLEEN